MTLVAQTSTHRTERTPDDAYTRLDAYLKGEIDITSETVGADDQPDTRGIDYLVQLGPWALVDLLRSSTHGVRRWRELVLPREPKEGDANYDVRARRTFLYEAYLNAIEAIKAAPFSKEIQRHGGELPGTLEMMPRDADGRGKSETVYFGERFLLGVHHGYSATLVDAPQRRNLRESERRERGLHPFFVPVDATNLIGWSFDEDVFGDKSLASIRIRDTATMPKGVYGQRRVSVVREWTKSEWRVWVSENLNSGPYSIMVDAQGQELRGANPLGEVPLRVWYSNCVGPLLTEPPLLKLAWLNLAHLQSWSDKRNLVRKASLSILAAFGFSEEEFPDDIVLGQFKVARTSRSPSDADVRLIESSGEPIALAEKEIEKIEARMETLAAEPFVRELPNVTATARAVSDQKTTNQVQTWSRSMESHIRDCYGLAAKWDRVELEEDHRWQLHDHETFPRNEGGGALVVNLWEKGGVTRRTMLSELQRRNELDRNLDLDGEEESLDLEQAVRDEQGFTGRPEDDGVPDQPLESEEGDGEGDASGNG